MRTASEFATFELHSNLAGHVPKSSERVCTLMCTASHVTSELYNKARSESVHAKYACKYINLCLLSANAHPNVYL